MIDQRRRFSSRVISLTLGAALLVASSCGNNALRLIHAFTPCISGVPVTLRIQNTSFTQSSSVNDPVLSSLTLSDALQTRFYIGAFDACDRLVTTSALTDLTQWQLSSPDYGYLSSSSGSDTQLNLTLFATLTGAPVRLSAALGSLAAQTDLTVSWTPASTSGLLRWYKADSLMPLSDDVIVGESGSTPVKDLSRNAAAYDATASTNREPLFYASTSFSSRPLLRFCGGLTTCSPTSLNEHLRIGSTYADFAATDFTLFIVAARANASSNYYVSNQIAANNTGIFLGYTSNTNLRFSLAGPGGTPSLNLARPAYSGSPALEILTARLDTNALSPQPGMQIYLDGGLAIDDSSVSVTQASAVTLPYLGTSRNENNSSSFYVGEFLFYTRALDSAELCAIHSYLNVKFNLELTLTGC